MSDARWWRGLRLARIFSLVFLVLAGCGGSNGTGGGTAVGGTSRLLLHVTTPAQDRSSLTQRAVSSTQTRQAGSSITRLRVEVSGAGIATPIVVECSIPGPSTANCQVTETPTEFIVEIELAVPIGVERVVVVSAFDSAGVEILHGTQTVDLTQAVQTVPVTLVSVNAPVNTPPRADAGPDQTVVVGTTLTLFGTGSSDVDGDALTFAWSFLIQPSGSRALLSDPTSVTPIFVVDHAGTYMVQLIVNDGKVDSSPDVVTITTGNSAPVANAGTNQTVAVGATVTLNGSGSSDVDGDALTFSSTV